MFLETLTFAVSAVVALATLLVGTPLVSLASEPGAFRRLPPPTPEGEKVAVQRAGFTPLDLGPDPISWPSETSWGHTPTPQPAWPSELWDDPQFGLRARRRSPPAAPVDTATPPDVAEPVAPTAASGSHRRRGRTPVAPPTGETLDPELVFARIEREGLTTVIQDLMASQGWDMSQTVAWLQQARRARSR